MHIVSPIVFSYSALDHNLNSLELALQVGRQNLFPSVEGGNGFGGRLRAYFRHMYVCVYVH